MKGRSGLTLSLLVVQLSFLCSFFAVLEIHKRHLALITYAQVPSNQVEFYADVFEKYVVSQEVINPGYSLDLDIPHVIELEFQSDAAREKLKTDVPEITLTTYKDQDRAFLFVDFLQMILLVSIVFTCMVLGCVLLVNRLPFLRVFNVVEQLGIPSQFVQAHFNRESAVTAVFPALAGALFVFILTAIFGDRPLMHFFKGQNGGFFVLAPCLTMLIFYAMAQVTSRFRSV